MLFTGKVGDSVFIDDLGSGHRYVILTQPNADNKVVIVNFTTKRIDKDCTVTLNYRDHPSLFPNQTVVNYPYASLEPLDKFKVEATNPDCNYIYCPDGIIQKIIEGAFQSLFTPMGVLGELKEQYPDIANKYYKIT